MDDTRYDRLLDLLFDLQKDISEIKEDTTLNTVNLELHMKRTDMNEDRLERLEKRDLMFNGFLKISLTLLAAVSTIIGIAAAIHALL